MCLLERRLMSKDWRQHIAALIGASPKDIIFTSGATESNNMSVKGVARFYRKSAANSTSGKKKNHIITLQTEHKCVLDSCRVLQDEGFEVTYLPVQENGIVDLQLLESSIKPETVLVSVRFSARLRFVPKLTSTSCRLWQSTTRLARFSHWQRSAPSSKSTKTRSSTRTLLKLSARYP